MRAKWPRIDLRLHRAITSGGVTIWVAGVSASETPERTRQTVVSRNETTATPASYLKDTGTRHDLEVSRHFPGLPNSDCRST